MIIKLLMTNDSYDVLNKDYITVKIIDFKLKKDNNILTPIIDLYLTGSNLNINYAEIPDLKRFYFIEEKQVIGKDLYRLYLKVDVLESYKTEILESFSITYLNSVLPDTKIFESDFEEQEMNYILATVGEKVSD